MSEERYARDLCLCGHWKDEHTKPDGQPLACSACACRGFASQIPGHVAESWRGKDSVCVHVARGELEPFMLLVISAGPAFAPPTDGPIARRLKCCALCLGWIEAVTRFGLPVRR